MCKVTMALMAVGALFFAFGPSNANAQAAVAQEEIAACPVPQTLLATLDVPVLGDSLRVVTVTSTIASDADVAPGDGQVAPHLKAFLNGIPLNPTQNSTFGYIQDCSDDATSFGCTLTGHWTADLDQDPFADLQSVPLVVTIFGGCGANTDGFPVNFTVSAQQIEKNNNGH